MPSLKLARVFLFGFILIGPHLAAHAKDRVTVPHQAETIMLAAAAQYRLAANESHPGKYYIREVMDRGKYFQVALCRTDETLPADWCGSELAGWYGVRKMDGRIVEWDVADDLPGPSLAESNVSNPPKPPGGRSATDRPGPVGLHTAELSLVISDSAPNEDYRVLLESFDAFSRVARSESPHYTLIVDVPRKQITVHYSGAKSRQAVCDSLIAAFQEAELTYRLAQAEVVKARVHSLIDELDREPSPTRRQILQPLIRSLIPPWDPPSHRPRIRLIQAEPKSPSSPS